MRFDTHSHYSPEFYRTILQQNNISLVSPPWNASSHIEFMDILNISVALVSVTTPGAVLYKDFPLDQARQLARKLNEYGYSLAHEHTNRFRFLATLTLPDMEGSVAEAVYALDTLRAAGVILMASNFGFVLGDDLYEPLYSELDKRSAVVFVHPGQTPCRQEITDASEGIPPYIVDFLLDTTRAAVNLVRRNVTKKYPNIRFLLAHSGGFLPFATQRIFGAFDMSNEESLAQLQKFYVDTAISASRWALPSTLELFHPTHVAFGSDFPLVSTPFVERTAVDLDVYVRKALGRSSVDQIRFKTASELFAHSMPLESRTASKTSQLLCDTGSC